MKTFNVPQFYNGFCCYFKSISSFDKVIKLFTLFWLHPCIVWHSSSSFLYKDSPWIAFTFLSSAITFNTSNSFYFMLWHCNSSSTFGILILKLSICISLPYLEITPTIWLRSLWYVCNAKPIIPYALDQGTQAHVKYSNP